jgi:hypothetical protein
MEGRVMTPSKSQLTAGVDVPWVTSWSAETVSGVGPCETIGGRLALRQAEQPGFGKPQYSMNHLRRQRLTVGGMLCPMCGRPTAEGDRWTQTARRTDRWGAAREGPGPGPAAGHGRPPDPDRRRLDRAAASRLRAHLPAALPVPALHDEIDVQPFPRRWTVWPLYIEARAVGAHMLSASQPAVAVVTFLQLIGLTV